MLNLFYLYIHAHMKFFKITCTNSTIMNMPKLKGYLNMNTGSLFQHKGDISLKYVNSSFQLHVLLIAFL